MKLDHKVFGLGVLLGVLAAVAPGCGGGQTACNSSNCANGCCSAAGACLTGTSNSACGKGGAACVACTTGNVCSAGACVPQSTGGGTGGGATGGGTGGGDTGGGTGGGATGGGTGGGDTGGGTGGGATGGGTGGGDTGGGTGGGATGGGTGGGDTGGGTGGGATGGGTGGGGGVDVNAQIAAVRNAADTAPGAVSLPINGALVTYLKPLVPGAGSSDPAGFFLQGDPMGPALFVAVDPSTLAGGLAVGDLVELTVDSVGKNNGLRQATAVSNVIISSRNNPVSGFVQNVSNLDFAMASNIDDTESELTSLTGTVTAVGTAGAGYSAATLTTAGTTSGTSLRLRLPTTLQATEDLAVGCTVSFSGGPMWRFMNTAQPSAWSSAELAGTTCPAPRVTMATAINSTTVRVTFDRNISSASVTPGAFTITGGTGLTVSGAMNSTPNQVVLTTSPQVAGTTYTVTVDGTVRDTRGTPVDQANNTATFLAARPNDCTAQVVISQVYGGGGNSGAPYTHDFVELHNRTAQPVDLTNWAIHYQSANGSWPAMSTNILVFDGGVIAPGGYFLVQMAGGNNGSPLPTPDKTGTLMMSSTSGKVVLANSTAPLSSDGGCPVGPVVDFVAYGSTNCAETTPAPVLSNTTAALRNEQSGTQLACFDTNDNSADFVSGPPAPRNSASPANVCTCP